MDFAPLISRKRIRFEELESLIASGEAYSDPRKSRDIMREHTRLKELMTDWDSLQKARTELAENSELAKGSDELAEMAQAEIPALEKKNRGAGARRATRPAAARSQRGQGRDRGNPRRHRRR